MKLEINTNGSWRTVLRGLSVIDQGAETMLHRAKAAAAELAEVDSQISRKPHSWRLVSEADDRVVEMCHGLHGWQHMYRRPGEDAC